MAQKFYLDTERFLTETGKLPTTHQGALMLILMHLMKADGVMPLAKVASCVKATPAQWRRMSSRVLSFFTVKDDQVLLEGSACEAFAFLKNPGRLERAA